MHRLRGQDQHSGAEQQLQQLRQQIKAITAEQRKLDGERSEASQSLREADALVGDAVRALRRTEAGIATTEIELRDLQAEQARLEAGLSEQREALAALVRSAYALGRHEQLKLLLAQDRMADLARVLAYHRYFQADRQQRIQGLIAELQALAAARLGRFDVAVYDGSWTEWGSLVRVPIAVGSEPGTLPTLV